MKKLIIFAMVLMLGISAFSQKRISQPKTKEQQLNEQYCSGLFNTPDGIYFDMLNDITAASAKGYLNILDWLNGRVAGLQVYTTRGNTRLPYIRNSRAAIYIDEIQVSPDFMNSLSVNDIAMIKVIKGPFAGGFNSAGGVIAIYTIRGDEDEEGD
ncbi:MAG TPA: TonB-dependent receptor plug domain-containing protein [Chitinophagaceae bacterium]|nr:TonB-dependent receptor plug domain-containing protein [Chitinophagaceae bacterium]